jgi:hypothetical protein
MFRGHLDYFRKPPLGGRPHKNLGDHGTPNAHHRWLFLFYHVWGPAWIKTHWKSIWLRVQSRMASHNTWEFVTTPHDLGDVFRRPLDTFFWANVRGELIFSVMTAGWFCEKSSWIGKSVGCETGALKRGGVQPTTIWGGGFLLEIGGFHPVWFI